MVAIGDNITAATGNSGLAEAYPGRGPDEVRLFLAECVLRGLLRPPRRLDSRSQLFPLAKITAILAMWGLFTVLGRTKRTFRDVPEGRKTAFATLIVLLFVSGFLSPIWRGGAVSHTIDFSKVYIAWILTFLLITSFDRLRRIIYIQTVSVAVICAISIIKGHDQPRLEGVLGGIYGNSNDLAFAIVLTLPFALAFLVTSSSVFKKAMWALAMLHHDGGAVSYRFAGRFC